MRRRARLLALAAAVTALASPVAAEIRVGVAVPLTGPMADTGRVMERAIAAAVAEVNSGGGLNGEPLTLEVADDGCAAATGEGAARHLVAAGVSVVIGHPCASAATAAAKAYGEANVLLIAVGPRHPDVTDKHTAAPILRLAGRDDRQGNVAAAWLMDNAPAVRMAIVHDRTGYARAIVDRVSATFKASGLVPVTTIGLVAGKHAYDDVVAELRKAGAEDVLFAGYPEEAMILISGMERTGLTIPVLGTDALATPSFAEFASRSKTRVQVLLPSEIPPRNESSDKDETLDGREARARGAFEAWLAMARKVGLTDSRTLAAAMRNVPIQTRSIGEIEFDPNGDLDAEPFATASASRDRWIKDD
jgi:branched-chain amino acid transport system substrate-binding protein